MGVVAPGEKKKKCTVNERGCGVHVAPQASPYLFSELFPSLLIL